MDTKPDTTPGGRLGAIPEDGADAAPHSTTEAFAAAGKHLKELQDYVGYYVAAKTDGLKLTLKNVGIYAGLGVVGLIAASALIIVAVVQLCYGIAGALGALFGGRLWLGELLTGLLLLAAIAAGTYLALRSITNKSRKATVDKYEARQRQQRSQFGHDVQDRAREQRAAEAVAD